MKVGYVGLGIMGRPMAERLVAAGHELVAFDTNPAAVSALVEAGATPGRSAADAAATSEIVFTSLPTLEAVESVYREMADVARPGQIFVDNSTVDLAICRAVGAILATKGASLLDAPVSGGRERAAAGTLTIFVGGEQGDYDKALPLLRACGTTIRLCGSLGAGTVMKLANQVLVIIHTAATAEAAVFAAKLGADPRVLLEMIEPSWGGSVIFSRHMRRIIARDFGDQPGPLRILSKDMDLVRSVAAEAGTPLLLGSVVDALIHETLERGMGEEDISAMVKVYEDRAGVVVQPPQVS